MKLESEEVLKIVADLGGVDASDEHSKGWDEAIATIYHEITKLVEIEFRKPINDYEYEYNKLKKECDSLICENKMLRDDREVEKQYSSALESVLKAVNLLTGIVANDQNTNRLS